MIEKLRAFFLTDLGEIVLHTIIAVVIVLLARALWDVPGAIIIAFLTIIAIFVRELSQHEWAWSNMGRQSHLEWVVPAIVVAVLLGAII